MKRLLLVLCFLVVGCETPYAPHSMTGGYKERQLDEDSYIVSFFGNGNTSEQRVWNFWIYRCAELTLSKGYTLFSLEPTDAHALLTDPDASKLVRFEMLDQPEGFEPVMYYYTTVTTYSSKAIVNMYSIPLTIDVKKEALLDAQTIVDALDPYVVTNGRAVPPAREDIFVRAAVEAAIKANLVGKEEAEKLKQEHQL